MIMAYPLTISEAAKLLDKEKLGWENKIDVKILDMTSYSKCILGQLYGEYDIGQKTLFGGSYPVSKLPDVIFGSEADKQLWINEIASRKNGFDFYTALKLMNEGKKVTYTSYNNISRVLLKINNMLYDSEGVKLPVIFDFVNCKFKLYTPPPTFGQINVGGKFKYKERVYLKVVGTTFNAVANDLSTQYLYKYTEIELCSD